MSNAHEGGSRSARSCRTVTDGQEAEAEKDDRAGDDQGQLFGRADAVEAAEAEDIDGQGNGGQRRAAQND